MSDLETIRSAIVGVLNTVPAIGQVHAYERYAKSEKDFRTLYQLADGDPILGWHVRRVRTRETRGNKHGSGPLFTEHGWEIRGYMALSDDGSELAFDALIEAIRAAFRVDDTLGGTVESCSPEDAQAEGVEVLDSGPVVFSGVLCHSARLALTTVSYAP